MEISNTIDFRTPAMKRKSSQYAARDKREVTIGTYERVSTRHQELAMKNQGLNLDLEVAKHLEWKIVKRYKDKGKSGTTVDKREDFKQMCRDIEETYNKTGKPPFELLVVAELCRFSRSLSDTMVYIDKFKAMGVEIFFVRDDIYTFSSDSAIKLGIYSGLAASESEKVRERVNAGLTACRAKGVLFGNGNILGYDLVVDPKDKSKNTYAKNADSATILQIFKWYTEEGYGEKKICSLLTEKHYQNTKGKVSWNPVTISRYLQCKTYAGYKSYLLSQTDTDGFHKREKLPESERIYIKGDWEPIVSLEMWEKAQEIRKSKIRPELINTMQRGKGKRPTTDNWQKVLVCECGKKYKKFRWRVNQTGKECYGFECRNRVDNRSRSFHIEHGLDGEGRCDVPSIPEWKLEYQFIRIMQELWWNPKGDAEIIENIIDENYTEEEVIVDDTPRISRQIDVLKQRMNTLVDKFLDGMISEDIYNEKYAELTSKISDLENELSTAIAEKNKIEQRSHNCNKRTETLEKVHQQLEAMVSIIEGEPEGDTIKDLVPNLVDRITPTESGVYRWYLALGSDNEGSEFDSEQYAKVDSIVITFEEARKWRRSRNSYIRTNQWPHDIEVEIYVRQ